MKTVVIQNLKIVKIMKSCNYTDHEIAKQLGIGVKEFLDIIESDAYLKEVYEKAQEKVATEIEQKFLENVMMQLDRGDNTDAKWVLERTNKRYQKREIVDMNIRTIDDVIRERTVDGEDE
jgi:hypothetical protein